MSKRKISGLNISKPQKLNIELIYLAKHNDLVGVKIYNDLIDNRDLWISVYGYFQSPILVPLRDMEKNLYHIDTINILCNKGNVSSLKKIVKEWNPSSIYILNKKEVAISCGGLGMKDIIVLEIWWD